MAEVYAPPDTPLEVMYADRHVLVLVKPTGLLSVPGRGGHLADCLASRAEAQFPGARIVHRLDRDTSGLLVMGLTVAAHRDLSIQFQERRTQKRYIALVSGRPSQPEGVVDLPLAYDPDNKPRQKICHETGRRAITEWKVIGTEGAASRMALTPITGRSHQLRVHMLALGHPILGDPLYHPTDPAPRLMLHAERLGFAHPAHGRAMAFDCPAPF
ncbi:MAG: RluA family pseudouridine synthase [Pseudomonadota bacterium]